MPSGTVFLPLGGNMTQDERHREIGAVFEGYQRTKEKLARLKCKLERWADILRDVEA